VLSKTIRSKVISHDVEAKITLRLMKGDGRKSQLLTEEDGIQIS